MNTYGSFKPNFNYKPNPLLGINAAMVATILEVMLKPATDQMPVDFAKALLKLRAEGDILDRIEYLRPRANKGELTADEQNEYREIVEANSDEH